MTLLIAATGPHVTALVLNLVVALGLSSLVGLEREYRQKSAGLRTNALVGLGAGLFMVISKYAFFDVVQPGVVLDPSRVAAQIVTGIGFIGGGIIFVRRGDVRGLTTAAGVWLTAAIGAAAGAGLLGIAALVTGAYYLVAFAYPLLVGALRESRPVPWLLHLEYLEGTGVLRAVLAQVSRQGFDIVEILVTREDQVLQRVVEAGDRTSSGRAGPRSVGRQVGVDLELTGKRPIAELAASVGRIDGVLEVRAQDPREESH